MEQLVVLGKHRDHKGYGRTRPIYSTIHSISPRSCDDSTASSNARENRAVFSGHIIQLRYDLSVHKTKALLNNLPAAAAPSSSSSSGTTGRLKSARLLPMGVVHGNGSEEKCLGIVPAQQACSRSSTMPAIPIKSSKAIIHGSTSDTTRCRARSAIPSSRTSMNVDDLLTVSTTRILNMSRYRASLCKQSHDRGSHDQRLHNKEQELTQKDEALQPSDSMPMITDGNIKVKIRLGHQPSEPSELPALPEATNNKQDSKQFSLKTNKQSVLKKPCSSGKLSPLTGAYATLPIGTLNGNSLSSTCKNDAIKSS